MSEWVGGHGMVSLGRGVQGIEDVLPIHAVDGLHTLQDLRPERRKGRKASELGSYVGASWAEG